MTLTMTAVQQPLQSDFTPRIAVFGVGGGGTNAVDNMIAAELQGVEFIVANTDAQQLQHSRATRRIQLGPHITQGLGAGADPAVGRAAAEEAADELYRHLDGSHMVFIAAGMGGGTGTGAAPVIARMARERNILTIGVVTKPFKFEGRRRMTEAEAGILQLQEYVDTLIIIPNQNLFRTANAQTTFEDAFKMADRVLYEGVRSVTDLMVAPGQVNLDFADVRTVMRAMGKAMMGTGVAEGENRALAAAEAAINNPLLEDTSMAGAQGLLINITGGDDLTLFEVEQAAERVGQEVDPDARIVFGKAYDPSMTGRIRVSVIATGIDLAVAREEERPRLVAVNGGIAMDPPAARAHAPTLVEVGQAAAAPMPAPTLAAEPSASATLRTASAPPPRGETIPMPPRSFVPNAAPRPAAPERGNIFATVTGMFSGRRHQGVAAPPAETAGRAPSRSHHLDNPDELVRPVVQAISGHDIEPDVGVPSFLRRHPNGAGGMGKS